jgi:hypothetical protein
MDATTEADKVHLIRVCADEIGRKYGIEPEELWGAGWIGVKVAETKWDGVRSFLSMAGSYIKIRMKYDATRFNGRRRRMLTGGTEK